MENKHHHQCQEKKDEKSSSPSIVIVNYPSIFYFETDSSSSKNIISGELEMIKSSSQVTYVFPNKEIFEEILKLIKDIICLYYRGRLTRDQESRIFNFTSKSLSGVVEGLKENAQILSMPIIKELIDKQNVFNSDEWLKDSSRIIERFISPFKLKSTFFNNLNDKIKIIFENDNCLDNQERFELHMNAFNLIFRKYPFVNILCLMPILLMDFNISSNYMKGEDNHINRIYSFIFNYFLNGNRIIVKYWLKCIVCDLYSCQVRREYANLPNITTIKGCEKGIERIPSFIKNEFILSYVLKRICCTRLEAVTNPSLFKERQIKIAQRRDIFLKWLKKKYINFDIDEPLHLNIFIWIDVFHLIFEKTFKNCEMNDSNARLLCEYFQKECNSDLWNRIWVNYSLCRQTNIDLTSRIIELTNELRFKLSKEKIINKDLVHEIMTSKNVILFQKIMTDPVNDKIVIKQ